MSKIGVTGACGYLGSRVSLNLKEEGYDVVPVDDFSNYKVESLPGLEIRDADISSLENIKRVFADVDSIIHLAASSSLEACAEHPDEAFENNVQSTVNIAWFCRRNEIPLSFASSVAVFGSPNSYPINEDTPRKPTNLYGRTKLVGEQNIRRLSENSFRAHIFNIANICGAHKIGKKRISRNNVLEIFLQKASEGEEITVYEPGNQSRDFISVEEVSEAFVNSTKELLDSGAAGAESYLLATGRSTSILDLAKEASNLVGKANSEIKVVDNPRESEVVAEEFSIDPTKIRRDLGVESRYDIEEIILGSIPDQQV